MARRVGRKAAASHGVALSAGESGSRLANGPQALSLIAWLKRYVYIYNVTFGLYMLEWWEQILFNVVLLFLVSAVSYKVVHFAWLQYATSGINLRYWTTA